MESLFSSGRIADLIVMLVAVEFAVLVAWGRRHGRGPGAASLAATLAAGLFLVLALRSALVGAGAQGIGPWLAAAFVAHLADMAIRFRR